MRNYFSYVSILCKLTLGICKPQVLLACYYCNVRRFRRDYLRLKSSVIFTIIMASIADFGWKSTFENNDNQGQPVGALIGLLERIC